MIKLRFTYMVFRYSLVIISQDIHNKINSKYSVYSRLEKEKKIIVKTMSYEMQYSSLKEQGKKNKNTYNT